MNKTEKAVAASTLLMWGASEVHHWAHHAEPHAPKAIQWHFEESMPEPPPVMPIVQVQSGVSVSSGYQLR